MLKVGGMEGIIVIFYTIKTNMFWWHEIIYRTLMLHADII